MKRERRRRHPLRRVGPRAVAIARALGWYGFRHADFRRRLARRHGLHDLRAVAFGDWHGGARYFSARDAGGRRVFVKAGGPAGTLEREVRVLERLASAVPEVAAHLPRLRAVEGDGEFPHLLLDWIDGVALDRGPRPSPDLVARFAATMRRLVDALRAAGVVHRDVRPGNLLVAAVDDRPDLVLIDFGLAVVPAEEGLGELPALRADPPLRRGLGQGWNPEPFVWDDAHAFREVVRELDPAAAAGFDDAVGRFVCDGRPERRRAEA